MGPLTGQPDMELKGSLNMAISANGTLGSPRLSGSLEIGKDLAVNWLSMGVNLSRGELVAGFERQSGTDPERDHLWPRREFTAHWRRPAQQGTDQYQSPVQNGQASCFVERRPAIGHYRAGAFFAGQGSFATDRRLVCEPGDQLF